ncbi:PREDICTED: transcription factor Adf-1-like [Rhagoletis zephyria]|uniref:transcription factor Adf-1-like n=1 Tax=Rhagoletis zephyria TaxID=28612 RepID=UPI00081173D5|nr:PREDICTED: transcription factor Adf-1-like [Rhagoletis zephyria]
MDKLSEELILEVKNRPYLYDDKHKEYKNLVAKEQAWKKIGEVLKMSPMNAKSRWKNLRDSYVKYKNQLNKVTDAAGEEAVNNRFSKWTGHSYLSFLDETLARRSISMSNVSLKSENIEATPPAKRARSSPYKESVPDPKSSSNRSKKKIQSRIRAVFHSTYSKKRAEKTYKQEMQKPLQQEKQTAELSESEANTTEFEHSIAPPENCLEISTTNGMVLRDNHMPIQMPQNKMNDTDIIFHYLEEKRKCQTVQRGSDAVDHLFNSYAQTFRSLPLRQQVNIKIELAKLFAKAEIESQS